MQRKIAAISPLALLTLTACGGGSKGTTITFGGDAVKGLLQNAWVFIDLDGDGVFSEANGEKGAWTNANGEYSITGISKADVDSASDLTVRVLSKDMVASLIADGTIDGTGIGDTTDVFVNQVRSGFELSTALDNSAIVGDEVTDTVVTPLTTIMDESGLTSDQVRDALGLPSTIENLATYNPFDVGVNTADAAAAEVVAVQIMNVITSVAAAGEGAGASSADAFTYAVNSVVNVIKDASTAVSTLDLSGQGDFGLDNIMADFKSNFTGADLAKIEAVEAEVLGTITQDNLNAARVTDLDAAGAADLLDDGVSSAASVKTSVQTGDASGIGGSSALIQLTSDGEAVTQMLENVEADAVVGQLSAIGDADVANIELVESDVSDNFTIVQSDGVWELQIADDAEFEADNFTEGLSQFKVTSSDGSVAINIFTLDVLNVEAFDGAVVKGPLRMRLCLSMWTQTASESGD